MLPWKLDIQHNFNSADRSFNLPKKLLVSAESTNCSPRVMAALGSCSIGVACKEIYKMMDDIHEMLRYVFQTKNAATLAIQKPESRGIETAIANMIAPGERMIVAAAGFWGERIVDIAKIRNIDVVKMHSKVGEVFTLDKLEEKIVKHKPVLLFITHGDSSGGTMQPLEGLGDICHRHGCLLAVDTVATLGGAPFFTDLWGIDVAISGSHKAIGAPHGMSLLTFSPKAVERMKSIKTPSVFYYNILRLCEVWNCFGTRTRHHRYHYTFNSHMLYALREALVEIVEEGLDNVWQKHEKTALRFWQGIEKMGLKHFVEKPENRLWTIHLFYIPPNIIWDDIVDYISEKYQVVLGTYNLVAQVGIMGYNARPEIVDYILEILEEGIKFVQSKHI